MKRLYHRPEAAEYLGMSASSFDAVAAPFLPHILIGRTGKRFETPARCKLAQKQAQQTRPKRRDL
ncbi:MULTISPECIES: hypothetical protein [unclassified Thiocapsa]|uniref:hypothetical protein n=1 Tax=unclassified Thiocapsa TaxID=2641286 RepID=UPI0035AE8B6C